MSLQIRTLPCMGCQSPVDQLGRRERNWCRNCINKKAYDANKILRKAQRLKNKRCRMCSGVFEGEGVCCTAYCAWRQGMKHRHYKIILTMDDLK